MLAQAIDQLRTRGLPHICNSAADEFEVGTVQFRQVEREGNLSFEPRLNRVLVGRDYVHRSSARQSSYVKVGEFAIDVVTLRLLTVYKEAHGKREDQDQRSWQSDDLPSPDTGSLRRLTYVHLDLLAKVRTGREVLSGIGHGSLHLHSFQSLCRTARTSAQVRPQFVCLRKREFTVDIGVEFIRPELTGHATPL